MELREDPNSRCRHRIGDWRYLLVLIAIYIIFLIATVYIISSDTRKQIKESHEVLLGLGIQKHTHVIESEKHDLYAREHLATIIAKIDDLQARMDDYYANTMFLIDREDRRMDK